MRMVFAFFLLASTWTGLAFSQVPRIDNPHHSQILHVMKHQDAGIDFLNFQSPKKPGHYTAEDWHALMDSLWGPGPANATKLALFDDFWHCVDRYWGGFPNLDVNWDSLRSAYQPLVEAGISRGRFAGILSRLTRALQDWHTFVFDRLISGWMGLYSSNFGGDEYPNYQSFHYLPGIPTLYFNSPFFRTHFGAGLTPLDDGSILVYNVMPDHPLGLQPGDIILGYDGIPWMQEIDDLFEAELPIVGCNALGTSSEAADHAARKSAGLNWGLFDTIDVVKYPANDTLHYPTSLLASINPPYLIATEQLPVRGVAFPDIQENRMVSWGIVKGTNIGYIYAWDWGAGPGNSTQVLFRQAVDELMHIHNVSGLILDFRTNAGGFPNYANDGFKQLFNFDPTLNYSNATRVPGNDHYAFTISPGGGVFAEGFTPTPEWFDHPIAVLLGPNCGSGGDYNAFRIRFHPMARTFGKPTNGAYVGGSPYDPLPADYYNYRLLDPYEWRIDNGCLYSNVGNEGFMNHKAFPVDEEVWLTRDGVARGEDDVVKRAIEWITTLTYAYDGRLDRHYARPSVDTVCVTARLTNPRHHSATLSAWVTDSLGVIRDIVLLYDDGLHRDGPAGDSLWGCSIPAPSDENLFTVKVRTDDLSQGSSRKLPMYFATAGPVTLDSVAVTVQGSTYKLKPFLKNDGKTLAVHGIKTALTCSDAWVDTVITTPHNPFPKMDPGQIMSKSTFSLKLNSAAFPYYFNVKIDISIGGWVYWTDSMRVYVPGSGVVEKDEGVPDVFALGQNFPNPFNSRTTIRYALPNRSRVALTVFNLLGEEVAHVVEGEKEAGYHEVQFNGSKLESGVYFCRLQAGGFTQTRKLMILR